MKYRIATVAMLAAAGTAHAQGFELKPLADFRGRYEHVDQEGLADRADALTFRLRGGLQLTTGPWSALAEGEGTLAAVGHYFDGLHADARHPLVGDPETVSLYRAQLQYRSPVLTLTAGRQRIALDDERFIGAVNFRQNGQTFDAVRAEFTPVAHLKADISYAWSARTVWGIDGSGARQQAVSGDNIFANLSYATPVGLLTGFAYLVDQDERAVQNFALSSQSYGARFAGAHAFSRRVKLSYQASYARQSDYHRNPNAYRADYYLIDAALDAYGWKLGGGYEVLGAAHGREGGVALTSFQTPLATGFKFQGWADKFLTTPPNGVRDLYGSIAHGWGKLGAAQAVIVQAFYHRLESDRLAQHYGNEVDLLASARFGRTTLSARYADYHADAFMTNTRKFWLQLDWTL